MEYQYSLVIFTTLGQLAAGLAVLVCLAGLNRFPDIERKVWLAALIAGILGMCGAAGHLHSFGPAPLSVTQVGTSWLSREIVAGGVFGLLVLLRLLNVLRAGFNALLALAGIAFVLVMARVYHVDIVPFWNTFGTETAFLGVMLALGGAFVRALGPVDDSRTEKVGAACLVAGVLAASVLPVFWVGGAGAIGGSPLLPVFATAVICMSLTRMALVFLGALPALLHAGKAGLWIGALLVLAGEIVGRMLFYASNIKIGF